jgi:hypothetical protein
MMVKLNYWLGIVVAIALLLESAFGIYSFIQAKTQQQTMQQRFSQNMQNGPGVESGNSGSQSSGSNNQFNGTPPGGGQRSGGAGMRAAGARTQASPVNLVVHIVTLILSATALVLTALIGRNNTRRKKEIGSTKELTDQH